MSGAPKTERIKSRPNSNVVTPDMIEAGYQYLAWHYDPNGSDAESREAVKGIYLAMMAAQHVDIAR